jgi:hypothetical protein
VQEAQAEEGTTVPGEHDGLASQWSAFGSLENGSQVAVEGEEDVAGRPQGQRDTLGYAPESPGQSAVVRQRDEDRERRRLGRGEAQVPRPPRRALREVGEREQGRRGDGLAAVAHRGYRESRRQSGHSHSLCVLSDRQARKGDAMSMGQGLREGTR